MSGYYNWAVAVQDTGNPLIDGLISGFAWGYPEIYYSFPTSAAEYDYLGEPLDFYAIDGGVQTAAHFALSEDYGNSANDAFSVEGFTNLNFTYTDLPNATLRFAGTTNDIHEYGTAWGNYPTHAAWGGDMWFYRDYSNAEAGNYAWFSVHHEIGHALGLKHGHEEWEVEDHDHDDDDHHHHPHNDFGPLPFDKDSMEYSVMTYRSFVGDDTGDGANNSEWDYPQTFMMADIAALQHMYGADYSTNSGSTVYKWNPNSGDTLVNGEVAIDAGGNKIFATIWDGGGIDTYDLSLYSSDLQLDLTPGGHSTFDTDQIAELGWNEYARGNIFNALLHKADTRSLIENAIGGSGDDSVLGNQADNTLVGGNGHDRIDGDRGRDLLFGGNGNDTLIGGAGSDTLYGGANNDTLQPGQSGLSFGDIFDGGSGTDMLDFSMLDGGYSVDLFRGALVRDITGLTATLRGIENIRAGKGNDDIVGDDNVNLLIGMDGNDVIIGNKGRDTLEGGAGDDLLKGGSGGDAFRYVNGQGADKGETLRGDTGHDKLLLDTKGTDTFDFQGFDVSSIEEIEFHAGGGNRTVTAVFSANVFDSNREFARDLLIDGNNAAGAMELIHIHMGPVQQLDISQWEFQTWGEQDDQISIFGDETAEHISGSRESDRMLGGGGDDTLLGNAGADYLVGDKGNDEINGGGDNDTINGGDGSDILDGSKGDDLIIGGAGGDLMTGGSGDDRFYILDGAGHDFITDFETGIDQIYFRRVTGVDSVDDLSIVWNGSDTIVDYGYGSITLSDVSFKDLSETDFVIF